MFVNLAAIVRIGSIKLRDINDIAARQKVHIIAGIMLNGRSGRILHVLAAPVVVVLDLTHHRPVAVINSPAKRQADDAPVDVVRIIYIINISPANGISNTRIKLRDDPWQTE